MHSGEMLPRMSGSQEKLPRVRVRVRFTDMIRVTDRI